MGNTQQTVNGTIYMIEPCKHYNTNEDGYEIYITSVTNHNTSLYLLKSNSKYIELLKYIEKNKSYMFTYYEDICEKDIILNITGQGEYTICVKIIDFIDLSKHNNNLKDTFELIHNDLKGPKLITKNIDDFIKDKTYDIRYKFTGITNYYNVISSKLVTPTTPIIENKTTIAQDIKNGLLTIHNYFNNDDNKIKLL